MNVNFRNVQTVDVRKFQEGGAMGPEGGAPMPEEGGAPAPEEGGQPGGGDQLQQVAGQILDMLMQQIQDPQMVMQILQTAMDMLQQSAGGGAPQGEPVYRAGGKLVRRIQK